MCSNMYLRSNKLYVIGSKSAGIPAIIFGASSALGNNRSTQWFPGLEKIAKVSFSIVIIHLNWNIVIKSSFLVYYGHKPII